jgi:TolB protein
MLSALSCGGDDGVSPKPPVLVDRVPMLMTSARGGNVDIYVMDADGLNVRRLTTDPAIDQSADWAPDGFKFAFMSRRDGDYEIYTMGSTARPPIAHEHGPRGFSHRSPDGSHPVHLLTRRAVQIYVMNPCGRTSCNPRRVPARTWVVPGRPISKTRVFDAGRRRRDLRDAWPTQRPGAPNDEQARCGGKIAWSPDGSKIAFWGE